MSAARRRNTTHRQRLARAWSAVSGRSYTEALTDIDKLTESNQAPSPLDPVGMVAALGLLAAQQKEPVAFAVSPAQQRRPAQPALSRRATGALRVPLTAAQLNDPKALASAVLRHVDDEANTFGVDDIRVEVADSRAYLHYRINGSLAPTVEVDVEVASAALRHLRDAAGLDLHRSDRVDAVLASGSRLQIAPRSLVSGRTGWVGVLRRRPRFGPAAAPDLPDDVVRAIERVQGTSGGRVLLTGGVGAGKTTLLYDLLRRAARTGTYTELRSEAPVIESLEVDGVRSCALFSADQPITDRLDADDRVAAVVGVDEVRTGQVAQRVEGIAADGKGVLATLHAMSVPMAFIRYHRLLHDGDSFVAVAPLLIVSVKAISTLCPHCRIPTPASTVPGWSPSSPQPVLYRANGSGCPECGFGSAGYSGRAHIVAALEITPTMWETASADRIEPYQVAPDGLVRTHRDAVAEMVAAGLCSYEWLRGDWA